jgi:hypothetical protein
MDNYIPRIPPEKIYQRQEVFKRILAGLPEDEKFKIERIINRFAASNSNKGDGFKPRHFGKKSALELIGCLGIWLVRQGITEEDLDGRKK